MPANRAVVEQLAEQLRRFEARRFADEGAIVSSGHAALDRLLPEGGFRRGALVEWLSPVGGGGAATLAFTAAREAMAAGGALVVIDRSRRFYPPAAARLGIALAQTIVVRPDSDADHAWAVDQVLRSRGVAAAWCAIERSDDHALRRWQLAAETSGVVGLLMRPAAARREPSWAELRLEVQPLAEPGSSSRARRLRVTLLRARSAAAGRAVEIELPAAGFWPDSTSAGLHHETCRVHLASQLAPAAPRRRSRRA